MTAADPPRPGRLPIVLVAFSLVLFGWTVREGREVGLHRVLPESIEKHESCVAVAVSELRYGLNGGYTAYRAVRAELQLNGWTWNTDILKQTGLAYPGNMTARDRLDYGLDRAANHPNPAKDGVDPLPIFAEDVGYADFAKLGFALFGFKLGSLYNAYFLVMGAGLGLYLLAHRRDVPMLLLLVGFQVAFFLLVRALPLIGTYEPYPPTRFQLATVINGRFLGTLGLVPFFHLAGCLLTWPRPTPGRVALAAGQAGMLGLALHFRGSVLWMFATLFALAAAPAAAWLWRNRRGLLTHPVTAAAAGRLAAARWPAVVVALGLVGQKAYVSSSAHWVYLTDDALPNHLVWHNALMGLEFHPDWKDHPLNPGAHSDGLAWKAVDDRLDAEGVGKAFHVSPLTRGYKARFHDQMCRRIYLEFVRRNPRFMAELMLWHKPKALWRILNELRPWVAAGARRADAVGLLAAFAGCLLLAARRADAGGWRVPVGAATAGLAGSLLPVFWAYPIFAVLNEFLVLAGVSAVGLGVVLTRAALRLRLPAGGWRVRLPGAAGRVTT